MKKSILFIITACFLFTSSCSDFLDEEHKTKYSSEYVFGTPEGLKLAVNALYALQRYYANDTENATIFALERGTDLAVTNGGTGNFYGIYDPNYLKPSASQVGFMWRTMYQIIGKANEIIAAAEDLEDTPSLRATVSEAKCFRAQSYFLLYRTFDRIWLNMLPTTAENVNDPRDFHAASEKEVFELIYEDLEYAITNLDWVSDEAGRFTQAAARHMKAKAALWLKDWDTTLEQVEEIEKSGHFDLIALNEVFNAGDLNHKEALMVQRAVIYPMPLQKAITMQPISSPNTVPKSVEPQNMPVLMTTGDILTEDVSPAPIYSHCMTRLRTNVIRSTIYTSTKILLIKTSHTVRLQ